MRRLLALNVILTLLILLSGCGPKPAAPVKTSQPSAASGNVPPARSEDEGALLDAAIQGDIVAVKALLDKGVNPNTRDNDGRTPLTEAAYYGHTEIARMLINHGADLFAKKGDGETPLTMAAGHKDIADLIQRDLGLLEVARKGDNRAVQELLDQGAYVNVRDAEGRSALTEAAWENHIDTVRLLLAKGADPNSRKSDGATPLGIASGRGNKELAELLKKAGAK